MSEPRPNELVRIQVRISDLPVLLDAIEGRIQEHSLMEDCQNPKCSKCARVRGALGRLQETLLNSAPKLEVG